MNRGSIKQHLDPMAPAPLHDAEAPLSRPQGRKDS
jgi:hypothetical protein